MGRRRYTRRINRERNDMIRRLNDLLRYYKINRIIDVAIDNIKYRIKYNIDINPKTIGEYIFIALYYNHINIKYDKAIKYYNKIIDFGNNEIYYCLADLYMSLENYIEAEKYYVAAIDHGTDAAISALVYLYKITNNITNAEIYFKLAVNKNLYDSIYDLFCFYLNTDNMIKLTDNIRKLDKNVPLNVKLVIRNAFYCRMEECAGSS